MNRRRILRRIGCALAVSFLAGCHTGRSSAPGDQSGETTESENRSNSGNRTAITVTEIEHDGSYTIGPSNPNCPGHTENASEHWGQLFTTTERIDEPISGPEEAGEILLSSNEHVDTVEVATPQVDTIEWKGETYNITAESATGEWYILQPDTHLDVTVLAVPQSDETTILREYMVGDC